MRGSTTLLTLTPREDNPNLYNRIYFKIIVDYLNTWARAESIACETAQFIIRYDSFVV